MSDSKELTLAEQKALAAMDAELEKRAAALRENVRAAGNNITVQKSGKFSLPNGTETDVLEMVILDARYRNQYFPKAFKQGTFNESVCFAVGLNPDGLIPSDASPDKQHTSCQGCPMNEFGSHSSGRGGQACQNQFLLAVLSPAHVVNMTERAGHPMKVVTKFTIDMANDYPVIKAAYAGPNMAFSDHFGHLTSSERALMQLPIMTSPDAETAESTADTASARGGGRSRAS